MAFQNGRRRFHGAEFIPTAAHDSRRTQVFKQEYCTQAGAVYNYSYRERDESVGRKPTSRRVQTSALSGTNNFAKESMMETVICRILMLSGVLVGVLLASGEGEQSLVPALLALVGAAVLRQVAPSLPWRLSHGNGRYGSRYSRY